MTAPSGSQPATAGSASNRARASVSEVGSRSSDRAWSSARPQFRAILQAAPKGSVDETLDADEVFDLLLGTILFRIWITSLGMRAEAPDNTVELICRTLAPPTRAGTD